MNNEEKQIEEMAEDIYNALPDYEHNFLDCRYAAKELTTKGYRKASDVVREIFEEIDKEYGENCGAYRIDDLTYGQLWDYLAELKKKYESEGGE